MMTYEKIKEKVMSEKESFLIPETRNDLLNTFLTLLVCEKLDALTNVVKELQDSLKPPVVESTGKPGRKPKADKVEIKEE